MEGVRCAEESGFLPALWLATGLFRAGLAVAALDSPTRCLLDCHGRLARSSGGSGVVGG